MAPEMGGLNQRCVRQSQEGRSWVSSTSWSVHAGTARAVFPSNWESTDQDRSGSRLTWHDGWQRISRQTLDQNCTPSQTVAWKFTLVGSS